MSFTPTKNMGCGCPDTAFICDCERGKKIRGHCFARLSANSTGAWAAANTVGYLAKAELCCNFVFMI